MAGRGRPDARVRSTLVAFFKRILPDVRRITVDTDVRRLSALTAAGWRALAADINALAVLAAAGLALSPSALSSCYTIGNIEAALARRPPRARTAVRFRGGGAAVRPPRRPRKRKAAKKAMRKKDGGSYRRIAPKRVSRSRKRAAPRKKAAPKLYLHRGVVGDYVPAPRPAPSPAPPGEGPTFPVLPRRPVWRKAAQLRYANASLFAPERSLSLPTDTSLALGQVVVLRLSIGPLSTESQVKNPQALPPVVQGKAELDVMVSSTDFAVAPASGAKAARRHGRVAHGRFVLPADGSAGTTPDGKRYLLIYLRAPKKKGTARCRIGYYFRDALVQSQQLAAAVGVSGGFSIIIDFTLSETLADLAIIPERPRLSVLTNDNDQGLHQIVIRRSDGVATKGDTFVLAENNVGDIVRKLRKKLTDLAPTQRRRSRSELIGDLKSLAPLGRSLYVQVGTALRDALRPYKDKNAPFIIQVVRPNRSKFVLPWGLCYDIPLDSQKQWTVCPAVDAWDGSRPLVTGAPRTCPHDHPRANVLCPFGFIGFRFTIEQPPSADTPALEIVSTPSFDFAVAETQYQLSDPKALEAHITALRTLGAAATPPAKIAEGKTRDAVQKLLGADLSLVYFFCHGNRPRIGDPNTYLAVGNDEAIKAEDFVSWVEMWTDELHRPIWGDVRPLIFINACHSLAIEPETLVSYLDAFVTWGHAAGVIGTEVKVAQPLAMDVAEQFFRRLLSRTHTVDTALHEIRLDYLASGNLFGLVYTSYCWADLRLK
jgi:hypothetical protein